MSESAEKTAVRLALAVSFVLFCLYSFITPLFEASDELWHYPLVQHLATGGALPVQRAGQIDAEAPWRQEGSQPPLYYATAAVLTAPFDSANWREIRRENPHSDMGRPTRDGNANTVLHSPAEQFPWTRAALAVHVARLLSAVLSTFTVLFTYLAACEVFPRPIGRQESSGYRQRDPLALVRVGSMAFVAGVPMFAFISGSVNNDTAAAMFSTLGLWWALHLARRHDIGIRSAVIAGVIGAAAALSKSSTLGILAVFGLAAVSGAIHSGEGSKGSKRLWISLGKAARFGLIMVFVTAMLAGWWFVRNQQLYGDLLGWNAFLDVVGKRNPPATLAQLWSEREGFVWAYWGVFGGLNVIMPPTIYTLLNLMSVIALTGLGLRVIRNYLIPRPDGSRVTPSNGDRAGPLVSHVDRYAPLILCGTWLLITFLAFLRWTSLTPASQGRLLFPCIAVIALAISYGLYQWHRVILMSGVIAIALLAFAVPFTTILPAYAKPTNLAVAYPTERLDITFGGALDLLGYDQPPASAIPGDEITVQLYWHLRAPVQRNYSIYVHVINAEDVIVGQRDMYPGQGSLATSEMQVGYTWQDHYTIHIPQLAPPGEALRWAVGVYDLQTGERLTVTTGTASEQGVVFGSTALVPRPEGSALLDYGTGIVLDRYDVTPTSLQPGRPLTVTLYWRSTGYIDTDYTVSLQLLDDKTNKIAQNDSGPVEGNAPTSSWAVGAAVTDTHVLQVAADAPTGVYRLLLVLYRPKDFTHLGAYDMDGIYAGTEVELEQLRVK